MTTLKNPNWKISVPKEKDLKFKLVIRLYGEGTGKYL
jgi:hypothetical protein